MREFMEYIQSAFYGATGWRRDGSYATLNATPDALLRFETPRGLRLALASLATPHFATAYQLGTVGVVDGSVAYLFSTAPLARHADARSARVPLPELLRSYRPLAELSSSSSSSSSLPRGGGGDLSPITTRRPAPDMLAYGRLYLPKSMLEALVVRRLSPALQLQVSAVSDQALRNGGTVLGMLQYDEGRYGVEGLASSDGGLLGIRGLYNFGADVENIAAVAKGVGEPGSGSGSGERDRIHGRLSAGGELYYGTLNKSGGMSFGARFATLPGHKGTPLTATMTINPLMGNVSWSYAVMAGSDCSLATKYDFNVYSYESEWALGLELWRKKGAWTVDIEEEPTAALPPISRPVRSFRAKMEWRLDDPLPALESPPVLPPAPVVAEPERKDRSFQAKMEWKLDDPEEENEQDEYSGVLKARLDHHWRVGLVWEGRVKSLLFSLGSAIDLRRLESPFRTLGLEVQFSS
ncbi:hypothetical protein GGR56DRAFT_295146 [Xylariaceae sp. FL0804]|nr:hypothetical protein GGR56DRAFT_295146 [Xylariaceae sp. FL0804]